MHPCTGTEALHRPYGPYGGVEVQLYPFMTTVLEGGEGSALRPGRSLPPGKTRYPLYRRLGGSQGRSEHVRKISPPTGIRSPDRPARSQSLCRLRYPAHSKQKASCKSVKSTLRKQSAWNDVTFCQQSIY